jgi:hypothetical protein
MTPRMESGPLDPKIINKVKLSCDSLIKHKNMKAYVGVELWHHHS